MIISLIGLSEHGLSVGACLALKGYHIIGYDKNDLYRSDLQSALSSSTEPELATLFQKSTDRFELTDSFPDAIMRSDMSILCVPTDTCTDGSYRNDQIMSALFDMAILLKHKRSFHTIVITSPVMPESCQSVFKPFLEKESGVKCSVCFGLIYNPLHLRPGTRINDMLNPSVVLIGESDTRSGQLMSGIYTTVCENNPHILRMSCINAEIARLSISGFASVKMSFTNELAALCELIPGTDVSLIMNALSKDSRIGTHWLTPGVGFSGKWLVEDSQALQAHCRKVGLMNRLTSEAFEVNAAIIQRIITFIDEHSKTAGHIAILGCSYEPGSHSIEYSQSIPLIQHLLTKGYSIAVHDPCTIPLVKNKFGSSLIYADSAIECVKNASALVVMTAWDEYRKIDWKEISLSMKDPILIDCWRIIPEVDRQIFYYFGLGLGKDDMTFVSHELLNEDECFHEYSFDNM